MLKSIFSEEFYFARHGETEYNSEGIVSGDWDIPLSSQGIVHSLAVSDLVAKLGIASAFCSPLSRAVDTARYLLSKTSVTPIVLNNLKERHWGNLQGVSKTLLTDYDFVENNVEDWKLFSDRTLLALKDIVSKPPVLIVAHSGTFRVLLAYLKINLEKKQVKNSYPYRFFKKGKFWNVTEVKDAFPN
ncbi:MAG: histidine phosphatase family protein [Deferribacteraceae bacterium]|jgi:broad specificity phosphatase PhoE|nr:histidine phosphatase family protein [Deferribacteraceae bacterium]